MEAAVTLYFQSIVVVFAIHVAVTVDCQLQQLCNEVNEEDIFSRAELVCTDVDFTVKLYLKMVPMNDLTGEVRIDLLCNDGTVFIEVLKEDHYLLKAHESFHYSFQDVTKANIRNCVLISCYSTYKYGSLTIHSTGPCIIGNLQQPEHQDVSNASNDDFFPISSELNLSTSAYLYAASASSTDDVSTSSVTPSTITVAMRTESNAKSTTTSNSHSVLMTSIDSTLSSNSSISTQSTAFQRLFSSLSSNQEVVLLVSSTPHASHFHNAKTSSTHQNSLLSNKLSKISSEQSQLQGSFSPSSLTVQPFPSTILAISVALSVVAVFFVVLIALMSCSLFLMKHYNANQSNEIGEDITKVNEQMSMKIDMTHLEVLRHSPSMITVLSPLSKAEQSSDNKIDIEQQRSMMMESCNSCPALTVFRYPESTSISEDDDEVKANYDESSSGSTTSNTTDSSTVQSPQLMMKPDSDNDIDVASRDCNIVPLQALQCDSQDNNKNKVNGGIRTNNPLSKPCKFCSDQKTYLHCYNSFIHDTR